MPDSENAAPAAKKTAPWITWLKNTALFTLALFVAFAALEGLAGAVYFMFDMARSLRSERGLASQEYYLEPDTLVGWRLIPNHNLPDFWGPGRHFVTNAQAFRNAEPVASRTAPGDVRLLCSGDSYTMGLGVANEDTFCALMEQSEAIDEAVNLGASGYGVGQALLRYQRDADSVEHHIHLFSMIEDDFRRMSRDRFVGYEKPIFRIDGDSLRLDNVPVPRSSRLGVWFTFSGGEIINGLHVARAGRRVLNTVMRTPPTDLAASLPTMRRTAALVLARVVSLSRERGATPVLMFLPIPNPSLFDRDWITLIDSVATAHGVPFIDAVTPSFRYQWDVRSEWFRPDDGHYTEAGHRVIADLIQPVMDSLAGSIADPG